MIRHSRPFRDLLGDYNANENFQMRNEKNPLSAEGEERARLLSEKECLNNIDAVYSSHYVRAMSTAKYICEKNNIVLNVDERFGERKFGISSFSELPQDFFGHQMEDWDYKIGSGECLNEVFNRMYSGFADLLKKYKGKNVVLVSHGTALSVLFSKWCNLVYNPNKDVIEIYFQNQFVFDGKWNTPELFKLVFEDDVLESIENIK
jgi:2,3-bisphosphoglycerate-dependent phosphoglycerate mutase